MAQEWFTLAELRAANLPCGGAAYRNIAARYGGLSSRLCRVRQPKPGDGLHDLEPEYHISLLADADRAALRGQETIQQRIARLGIWRPTWMPDELERSFELMTADGR